jgi:hypothetical protein
VGTVARLRRALGASNTEPQDGAVIAQLSSRTESSLRPDTHHERSRCETPLLGFFPGEIP